MSHQDQESDIIVHHQALKQVVDWLFMPALFASLKGRAGATWKPRMIAAVALFWATSGLSTLGDRFVQSRKIVAKIFRWQSPPGESYQGFIKMLRRWHSHLQRAIVPHVREQMREVLPGQWEVAGYVVFAGDGSRIELARTESLEAAFSPRCKKRKQHSRKKGKGKVARAKAPRAKRHRAAKRQSAASIAKKENSPQMWLTLFWHVASGLPWAWRTGPSDSSERDHLLQMLPELPENSLITADAGFVGYDFWSAVLQAGRAFVIRVGGNVRLLKNLGCARQHAHTVYLWPEAARRKGLHPLVLRLVVIHDGKQPVYLVTNLTKSQLSDRQAGQIYAARWGIELFFRTFKQTFGCRKLRSRAAENADLELDWSLLGLWCICLLGQRELAKAGKDPTGLGAAAAIKAFQHAMQQYKSRPDTRAESLWAMLRAATLDGYRRASSKTSRNYPRKKQRQAVGPPKITRASRQQIHAAKQLKPQSLVI